MRKLNTGKHWKGDKEEEGQLFQEVRNLQLRTMPHRVCMLCGADPTQAPQKRQGSEPSKQKKEKEKGKRHRKMARGKCPISDGNWSKDKGWILGQTCLISHYSLPKGWWGRGSTRKDGDETEGDVQRHMRTGEGRQVARRDDKGVQRNVQKVRKLLDEAEVRSPSSLQSGVTENKPTVWHWRTN